MKPLVPSLEANPSVLAQGFYENVHDRMDIVIAGESQAKDMISTLLITGATDGMAGILMGPPGGVKSGFLEYAPLLVEGTQSDEIARLKGRVDVTPGQVLGKETRLKKVADGVTSILSAKQDPLINRYTRFITADEANRTSPHLNNALLDLMQRGRIEAYEDGRPVEVEDIDLILAAINNYGTRHTFDLDPAHISRMALGAFVGIRRKGELSSGGMSLLYSDKYDSNNQVDINDLAKDLSTGYTRKHILKIRENIPQVLLSTEKKALIERLAVSALDRFEYDHEADGKHQRALGLTIADGRFIKQMKKTSRVISMMKGNEKVEDTDVIDSFNFALTAKIGAIGHTALQTAEIIHDIFEEAAS